MYNIDIEYGQLTELVKKLELDNLKIINSIDKIYNIMTKIDKNDWDSPEKREIDNDFVLYLKDTKEQLSSNLENRISVLKLALKSYQESDNYIKEKTEDLEVL